ncbi:unnamed protein product [Psylliodes chrysocephalus]|uniref:DUF7869 domain-containing protein n=1 Tax=Psylliodes chrysocephalus TaxID=3402493 RepID=A0A9P0G8Y2_9CUCU|nr:unnamed protein product [Psylliodes chrysocephala]
MSLKTRLIMQNAKKICEVANEHDGSENKEVNLKKCEVSSNISGIGEKPLEHEIHFPELNAGPSSSYSKDPKDKHCVFTRNLLNNGKLQCVLRKCRQLNDTSLITDSKSKSDSEPFKPDDKSDEYLPTSEDSSDTGKNCEKKVKKTNTWKNNVAAIARQRGETYTNQRGKKIPRKSVNLGTLCNEGCKKKCSEKVRPEERREIFFSYYKLLDEDTKNMLPFKCMAYKVPARPQKNAARHKSASFTYKLAVNKTEVTVCKKAFCTLYEIGKKKVEYLQQSIKEGLHTPKPNRRGKHDNRPHRIADGIKQYTREHIKSFPAYESHYSRNKNSYKKYLSPMLNISKMYSLYHEKCAEGNKPPRFYIKYCTYSKIFSTEFNFSFGEPRSDTCSTYDSGQGNEEHREDRECAKSSGTVCYLTMDLQQTLHLPKLTTSKAFYLRQMWMYNLGIHSISKQGAKANFFTWTEDVAHRGISEICSSLLIMLEYNNLFQDNIISHLILWTDSCAGQNKNFLIICLYQYLILKGMCKIIDHKFPEVGNSYLDSDRDFGLIEKVLRRHETIFLPEEYRTIISQASKMNQLTDMSLHFRNFDDLATKLNVINRKKNTLGENVPFRDKIKWIRVCEFGSYMYKESFDPKTPFKKVNIIRNSRIPAPENVEIPRIGRKTGELSAKKIANLKSQLQYIKQPYRWFYNLVINEQEKA